MGNKLFILLAIVFLLCGIVVIIAGLQPPPALVAGESLPYEEITDENSYYIQDLAVVWEYGSMTGTDDSGSYYLAYFQDQKGDLCAVSLYFDNDKEWKALSAAHNYEEADMYMSGCFRTKKIFNVDADMKLYYEECLADFRTINEEYLDDISILDTSLHFKFLCNDREDYESAAAAPFPQFLFGGLMILLGVAFIYIFIKSKDLVVPQSRIHIDIPNMPDATAPYTPNADEESNSPEF